MSQTDWDAGASHDKSPSQQLIEIRPATTADAATLHALAVATFALACPPDTAQESIDDFLATVLSEESFAGYLADPERALFIATVGGLPAGYTMVDLR